MRCSLVCAVWRQLRRLLQCPHNQDISPVWVFCGVIKKTKDVSSGYMVYPIRKGHPTPATLKYDPALEGCKSTITSEGSFG